MPKTATRVRAARRLRELPYASAHDRSTSTAWDAGTRVPGDLRDAVRRARRAYAEEVPGKLTEGAKAVGDDGNPPLSVEAVAYIFHGSMLEHDGVLAFERFPFKATLVTFLRGDEASRKRGAIVSRITHGGMAPVEAAVAEGVPGWCAKLVAEDALRSVLGRVSDLVVTR